VSCFPVLYSLICADCSYDTVFLLPLRPPPTSTLFPYTTLFRSIFGGNWADSFVQHVSGIQTGCHFHNGHTGFGIASSNRALNRGCTAPAWQQGTMNIQATIFWCIQNHLWQDQAIGRHHHHICI